jgi:hypothetical protein
MNPTPHPYGPHFAKILRDCAAVIRTAAGETYVDFAGGHGGRAKYSAVRRYAKYCRLADELERIADVVPQPREP